MLMTAKCVFCGAEETVEKPVENPVCDRPECGEKAKLWGWDQALRAYVEVQVTEAGTMFRLKQ